MLPHSGCNCDLGEVHFDFRKWAKQALGPSGNLVALLSPLRSKARAKALDQLEAYKREETGSSI